MGFNLKTHAAEIQSSAEIVRTLYLYGEGWDFGEVGNRALKKHASQVMAEPESAPSSTVAGTLFAGRAFDRGVTWC